MSSLILSLCYKLTVLQTYRHNQKRTSRPHSHDICSKIDHRGSSSFCTTIWEFLRVLVCLQKLWRVDFCHSEDHSRSNLRTAAWVALLLSSELRRRYRFLIDHSGSQPNWNWNWLKLTETELENGVTWSFSGSRDDYGDALLGHLVGGGDDSGPD